MTTALNDINFDIIEKTCQNLMYFTVSVSLVCSVKWVEYVLPLIISVIIKYEYFISLCHFLLIYIWNVMTDLATGRYCVVEAVGMIIDFAVAISYERDAIYGRTTLKVCH